jgi:predicted porin
MKLQTKLLCLGSLIATPIAANAGTIKSAEGISFYGKAEIQLTSTDKDNFRYVKEGLNIESPFSRIGFKGDHKLNDSLTAVFKYEYQAKGFDSSTDTLSARNTYIGLKGNFGEVVMGRNDTRFKASEGKFDLFNETVADIGQVFGGQDRLGDSVTYTSPQLGLVKVALTFTPKDDAETENNGYAWLVTAGDKGLKKSPYYLAYAGTQDLNGLDAHRILGQYKINNVRVGAMYQQSEKSDGSKDGSGFMVNAAYRMDAWDFKVQLGQDDSLIRHPEEVTQTTVGADYYFDSKAKVYALISNLDLESTDDNTVNFGLQYKF